MLTNFDTEPRVRGAQKRNLIVKIILKDLENKINMFHQYIEMDLEHKFKVPKKSNQKEQLNGDLGIRFYRS